MRRKQARAAHERPELSEGDIAWSGIEESTAKLERLHVGLYAPRSRLGHGVGGCGKATLTSALEPLACAQPSPRGQRQRKPQDDGRRGATGELPHQPARMWRMG